MKSTDPYIIVTETFELPIERVWKAITHHPEMIQWFFENIPSFEACEGFETTLTIENEGRVFPHIWKIVEVDPGKKITYDWSYSNYDGRGLVIFELASVDDKTILKLTNTVEEDFQEGIPEFNREACIGGWNYFIGQRLKNYLANETVD